MKKIINIKFNKLENKKFSGLKQAVYKILTINSNALNKMIFSENSVIPIPKISKNTINNTKTLKFSLG